MKIYMVFEVSLSVCDYLYKISIKINVTTDEGNSQNTIGTLDKRRNWSNCAKFAVSSS